MVVRLRWLYTYFLGNKCGELFRSDSCFFFFYGADFSAILIRLSIEYEIGDIHNQSRKQKQNTKLISTIKICRQAYLRVMCININVRAYLPFANFTILHLLSYYLYYYRSFPIPVLNFITHLK